MNKTLACVLMATLAIIGVAEAKHKTMEELNLTAQQREEAEQIFAKTHEKMEELRAQEREIKEKMHRVHEEGMAEFEKILTPEQKANLHQYKKEMAKGNIKKRKIRGMHELAPKTDAPSKIKKKHKKKTSSKGGFVEQ